MHSHQQQIRVSFSPCPCKHLPFVWGRSTEEAGFLRCDGMAVCFGVCLGLRAWGCTTSVLVVIFPTVCSFVRDWFGAGGVMPHYSSGFPFSQVYAGMPALTRGFCPGASFAPSLGMLGAFFQVRDRAVVQAGSVLPSVSTLLAMVASALVGEPPWQTGCSRLRGILGQSQNAGRSSGKFSICSDWKETSLCVSPLRV